jgi:ribosome-associated protein
MAKKKSPSKTAAKKKTAPVKAKKTAAPAKKKSVTVNVQHPDTAAQEKLRDKIVKALEAVKAEDILCVDVRGQSSFADFLIIATGRSSRQVGGLADAARKALYANGVKQVRVEGLPQGDWAVVDGGDVVTHIFRPEVRAYYRLEEVWGLEPPLQGAIKNL